ncbi:MAG: hypothetical protein KGL39_38665 [Patescibacteria group bacterium]|nr:hypothetical protein [Patescibacteria group bacterium]
MSEPYTVNGQDPSKLSDAELAKLLITAMQATEQAKGAIAQAEGLLAKAQHDFNSNFSVVQVLNYEMARRAVTAEAA